MAPESKHCAYFAKLPAVYEQQRTIRLVDVVENEGHHGIYAFRDVQIKGRDEEPDPRSTRQSLDQISLGP